MHVCVYVCVIELLISLHYALSVFQSAHPHIPVQIELVTFVNTSLFDRAEAVLNPRHLHLN